MKKFSQFLAVMLLACTQVFGQSTVSLIPDYDNLIGGYDWPTYNGVVTGALYNSASFAPPPTGVQDARYQSLIHFDLTTIANMGGMVFKAELHLKGTGPINNSVGHSGINASYLCRVIDPWNPLTASYSNAPSTTAIDQAFLPQSSSPAQDYVVDVTQMVKAMLVNYPNNNHGFNLKLVNSNSYGALMFGSKDHSLSYKRPVLYVTTCNSPMKIYALKDAALGIHSGQNTSGTNYSGVSHNSAYSIPGSDYTMNGNRNRALIQFDLPNFPTNTVITSAKLNLFAKSNGSTNGHFGTNNATNLLRVTAPWYLSSVTWDNQPPTGAIVATLPQSTSNHQNYLNIDITQSVQSMISNPGTNYGYMLKLANEMQSNGLVFHSADNGVSLVRPYVSIVLDCYQHFQKQVEVKESVSFSIFPNPARSSLSMTMSLSAPSNIAVELFDMQGRELRSYHAYLGSSGSHTLDISTLITDQPAGIYIVRAKFGEQVIDRKLVLTGN